MNNSKTNPVTIDLRRLTNRALYATYRFLDAKAAREEYESRGFDFEEPLPQGNPDRYGKYPTLEEYLATFPEPQDNRENGGC